MAEHAVKSLANFSWKAAAMQLELIYVFPLCAGGKLQINLPNSCLRPLADGVILI